VGVEVLVQAEASDVRRRSAAETVGQVRRMRSMIGALLGVAARPRWRFRDGLR